jgi:hypothetical protein
VGFLGLCCLCYSEGCQMLEAIHCASRHSFRSGRPELFLQYGRMYESNHLTCVLLLPIVEIFFRSNEDIDLDILRFLA